MKKTATLWRYFLEKVTAALTSVGAVSAPEHWTRHRWLLQTVYGSYELTVHNPELSDIYTFSVFGRFLSDGPFPAAANQHSGKLNFHLLGPETKITRADIDDFVGRMKGRLEAMLTLTRENPRQDFGALERAWEDARLRDYYAREKRDADFRDSYLLVIYEGDQPVVETRSIEQTRSGRWEVTDDYLNESDNAMPWREVNRLLKEHDPKPDKGRRLVIELPAPNPMLKPKISREGKAWRWEVRGGRRRVAGGYGRTKAAAENDARVWLQEQARQNPAVTGERGQYRLHYMEPGARKGTFRQAIRRVDSVSEAERWMNDNAGRAFLPASVMTPGNRWQSPDVVAILGPDRIPAAATATSYDRLPV